MENLKIGTSPLTGTIFAGRLNKAGNMRLYGKIDVTDMATTAVAESLLRTNKSLHFQVGKDKYILQVVKSTEP